MSMRLLAIDPGPDESAYLLYDTDTRTPVDWDKVGNEMLVAHVARNGADELAIEMVASYGMPVGAEVFETCVWIGRFIEAWFGRSRRVYRRDVKLHLCHDSRASDANIRQALLDRYGGKQRAIGRKATPGPLYGIVGDGWAALALAITAAENGDP